MVWQKFIPTAISVKRTRIGHQKKTTLREHKIPKSIVQRQLFIFLGTVILIWNDEIGKVVSQSTAIRIHSGSLSNHSLDRKADVVEPNDVPELHTGRRKVTGPELSFRVIPVSILPLMVDE